MRDPKTGTPKTLATAIRNGINTDCIKAAAMPHVDEETIIDLEVEEITAHVRDYLSQKFTVAIGKNSTLPELWKAITGDSL